MQNKILKEMSSSVLRDIVEFIKNAVFHSIMIDETLGVSNKKTNFFLCLLGRWKPFFIWRFFRTAWNEENQCYKDSKFY